jgi:hypothetical protein
MREMNSIEVSPDGKSVTMGRGVKAKEVTDILWAVSKQTGKFLLYGNLSSENKLIVTSHWNL